MKLVHWPLMGGLLHLAQRGGDWAEPHRPLLAVPNATAHPSTIVLLYNGPFSVALRLRARIAQQMQNNEEHSRHTKFLCLSKTQRHDMNKVLHKIFGDNVILLALSVPRTHMVKFVNILVLIR